MFVDFDFLFWGRKKRRYAAIFFPMRLYAGAFARYRAGQSPERGAEAHVACGEGGASEPAAPPPGGGPDPPQRRSTTARGGSRPPPSRSTPSRGRAGRPPWRGYTRDTCAAGDFFAIFTSKLLINHDFCCSIRSRPLLFVWQKARLWRAERKFRIGAHFLRARTLRKWTFRARPPPR